MAVVKYQEGMYHLEKLESSLTGNIVIRMNISISGIAKTCISCLQNAMNLFDQMHHYSGFVLTAEKI
jgi:hypothetical protein